jgi:hypothetical protein
MKFSTCVPTIWHWPTICLDADEVDRNIIVAAHYHPCCCWRLLNMWECTPWSSVSVLPPMVLISKHLLRTDEVYLNFIAVAHYHTCCYWRLQNMQGYHKAQALVPLMALISNYLPSIDEVYGNVIAIDHYHTCWRLLNMQGYHEVWYVNSLYGIDVQPFAWSWWSSWGCYCNY